MTRKNTKKLFLFLALAVIIKLITLNAYAEKEKEFKYRRNDDGFTVVLTFETEIVDFAFVSPSGKIYTKNHENVKYVEGDLYSVYKIIKGEEGSWKVRYDLKSNTGIDYSIVSELEGLSIREFKILSRDENKVKLKFTVDAPPKMLYSYYINLVDTKDRKKTKHLISSSFESKDEIELEVELDLNTLPSSNYHFELKIIFELPFNLTEKAISESFDYQNKEKSELKLVKDFDIKIDRTNYTASLSWEETKDAKIDEYHLIARQDGEILFEKYISKFHEIYSLQDDIKKLSFDLVKGKKVLDINLEAKLDKKWYNIKEKKINIENDYIWLDSNRYTDKHYVNLFYKTSKKRELMLSSKLESKNLTLSGKGKIKIDLHDGTNDINASMKLDDSITSVIDTKIEVSHLAPIIILDKDINGEAFSKDKVNLSGRVIGGNSLKVNGIDLKLKQNGRFDIDLDLEKETNEFELLASDAKENQTLMNLSVYRREKNAATNKISEKEAFVTRYMFLGFAFFTSIFIILITVARIISANAKKKENTEKLEKKENKNNKRLKITIIILSGLESLLTIVYIFSNPYKASISHNYLDPNEPIVKIGSAAFDYTFSNPISDFFDKIRTELFFAIAIIAVLIAILSRIYKAKKNT